MTKAKAIALLNEMHSHCILRSATDAYDDALRDQKGEALMMAIEALSKPTVSGWIPVKERLPENSHRVIVCLEHGTVFSARYRKSDNIWVNGFFDMSHSKVVAWMPLPEVYKEDGHEGD